MNKNEITEIIDRIRLLRINILPPYCYDADESEKSSDEYLSFYSKHISTCIKTTEGYLNAYKKFLNDPQSDKALQDLIDVRACFITHLPFTYDELLNATDENLDGAYLIMREIYRKDSQTDFLYEKLVEYYEELQVLANYFGRSDR